MSLFVTRSLRTFMIFEDMFSILFWKNRFFQNLRTILKMNVTLRKLNSLVKPHIWFYTKDLLQHSIYNKCWTHIFNSHTHYTMTNYLSVCLTNLLSFLRIYFKRQNVWYSILRWYSSVCSIFFLTFLQQYITFHSWFWWNGEYNCRKHNEAEFYLPDTMV